MNTYKKMTLGGPLWGAQELYQQDELLRANKASDVGIPNCALHGNI